VPAVAVNLKGMSNKEEKVKRIRRKKEINKKVIRILINKK
jgi:hypothetical protein